MATNRKRSRRSHNEKLLKDQLEFMLIGSAFVPCDKWHDDLDFPFAGEKEFETEYRSQKDELIAYAISLPHLSRYHIPWAVEYWEEPEEATRIFNCIQEEIDSGKK